MTKPGQRPDFATRARQVHEQRAQFLAVFKDDPEQYETVDSCYEIVELKLTQMASRIYPVESMDARRSIGLLRDLKSAVQHLTEADIGGNELFVEIINEVDAWVNAVKSRTPKRQR